MSGDISKEEKERQLDEKIRALRAKNAQVVQRKLEVDKDKQLAEKNRSSITSAVKPKFPDVDSFSPPEPKFRGSKSSRNSREDPSAVPTSDSKRESAPQARRVSGRLGDADGPPPDPGYRFLADRMREGSSDEAEVDEGAGPRRIDRRSSSDAGGMWARGHGGTVGSRGTSSRGVGNASGGGRGRSDRFSHVSHDDRRERRTNEDFGDIQPFTAERSGGAPRPAGHHTNHSGTPLMEDGRYIAPFRHDRGQGGVVTPHESYSAKVKSLLAEDTPAGRFRLDSANSWMGEEDDEDVDGLAGSRPILLSSPRKIEAAGGKITITRTMESSPPDRNADSGSSAARQYRSVEGDSSVAAAAAVSTAVSRPTAAVTAARHQIYSPPSNGGSFSNLENRETHWKCPGPVCGAVIPITSPHCTKCGMSPKGTYDYANSYVSSEPAQNEFIPYGVNSKSVKPMAYSNGLSTQQATTPMAPQPLLTMEEQVKAWEEDSMSYDQQGDWVLVPQYGMLMNQMMSVPSFPPPFFPGGRHPGLASGVPQYYAQPPVAANYLAGTYQHHHHHQQHQADYAPYQEPAAVVVTSTTTTAFNPSAQAFVPPAEQIQPGMYQSPPPAVIATPSLSSSSYHHQPQQRAPHQQQQRVPATLSGAHHTVSSSSNINNNMHKKPDPSLLVSLKSPPTPLPFSRSPEARNKQITNTASFNSKFAPSSKPSPATSRPQSADKYSLNSSRLPPRFQKNREISSVGDTGSFLAKHISVDEMKSINEKKGAFPRPPTGQGSGLLVFGTSNIVNYLKTEQLTAKLNIPVRLIPAMKQDVFEEKVEEVSPDRDWMVLVHGLGRYRTYHHRLLLVLFN